MYLQINTFSLLQNFFVMLFLAGLGKSSKCSRHKYVLDVPSLVFFFGVSELFCCCEMGAQSGAEFVALMNASFKVLE